jgi:phosphate transport system substrate-binding protein
MVLSGSTTVQTRILEPLAADIQAATGIAIKVEGVGSGNGLKRLFAGEVPAAIVSAELKSLLTQAKVADDGTYRQHVVLEDLIVPIVNAANPVNALSWDQLKALFSGSIRNWREVGGADLPVRVITSHPESATREVVWELVMGKKVDYHRSARIVYATKKELVLVAESSAAVGAVSQGFVDQYLAEIAKDGEPSEIKVVATQRISRPLAVVTKGEPEPQVAKLLAFLRSDHARAKFR